jgi:surface protein
MQPAPCENTIFMSFEGLYNPSWNCIGTSCIDPGDGSGQYDTLSACTTACTPPSVSSYNCNAGNCLQVIGTGGQYPTLQQCSDNCSPLPVTSYNCVNCLCNSVGGPGGQFQTLEECLLSGCNDTFTTTWETTTAGESITLPYYLGGTYSGTIDWGDSTTSANSFTTSTHIYATPGIHTVTICGTTVGWNFNTTSASILKIKSVVTWGQLSLGANVGYYFNGCCNLDLSSVTDTLDLFGTGITNMAGMFVYCNSLTSVNNINFWDTSAITDMSQMFEVCWLFNQPLSFDTSAVTDMSLMFNNCFIFNSTITFDTSAVIYMFAMFADCTLFDQPLFFDTGIVDDMGGMFQNCTYFNSVLTFTSTAAVTNMNSMFYGCSAFNQALSFNTSAVDNMGGMFQNCLVFNSVLTFASTSAVTDMSNMFANALAFQQNIGSWNITSVTNFTGFMTGKTPATWSQTNFNLLLCGWSLQTVVPGLTIDFGSAVYTTAIAGPCYNILDLAPNLWTINSAGGV